MCLQLPPLLLLALRQWRLCWQLRANYSLCFVESFLRAHLLFCDCLSRTDYAVGKHSTCQTHTQILVDRFRVIMFSRKDSRAFDECLRLDDEGDGRRPKHANKGTEGRNPAFIFKEAEKGKKKNKPRHGAFNLKLDLDQELPNEKFSKKVRKRRRRKRRWRKNVSASSIQVGQWVRLKRGLYKDDLAQVDSLHWATRQVCLRLIPRIDYSRLRREAQRTLFPWKRQNEAVTVTEADQCKRAEPKLFDLKAVRAAGGGEVSSDGDGFTIFEANRYRGGFLYQNFSLSWLRVHGVTYKPKEVKKFNVHPRSEAIQMRPPYEVEAAMDIKRKYHHLFVTGRTTVCRQFARDYGGVTVSFPPAKGKTTSDNRILLKGAPKCVEAVKGRIAQMIADYEAQVTLEVEIDVAQHPALQTGGGAGGISNRVKGLQAEHSVCIQFPAQGKAGKKTKKAKKAKSQGGGGANGQQAAQKAEEEKQARALRTVRISGRPANCEAARQALLSALMPRIALTFLVPSSQCRRKLVSRRGSLIGDLCARHRVQISSVQQPQSRGEAAGGQLVTVTGHRTDALAARQALLALLSEPVITAQLAIDSRIHSRLIGSRGAAIRALSDHYWVRVRFPEAPASDGGASNSNLVLITGQPGLVQLAKEHLVSLADYYLANI